MIDQKQRSSHQWVMHFRFANHKVSVADRIKVQFRYFSSAVMCGGQKITSNGYKIVHYYQVTTGNNTVWTVRYLLTSVSMQQITWNSLGSVVAGFLHLKRNLYSAHWFLHDVIHPLRSNDFIYCNDVNPNPIATVKQDRFALFPNGKYLSLLFKQPSSVSKVG